MCSLLFLFLCALEPSLWLLVLGSPRWQILAPEVAERCLSNKKAGFKKNKIMLYIYCAGSALSRNLKINGPESIWYHSRPQDQWGLFCIKLNVDMILKKNIFKVLHLNTCLQVNNVGIGGLEDRRHYSFCPALVKVVVFFCLICYQPHFTEVFLRFEGTGNFKLLCFVIVSFFSSGFWSAPPRMANSLFGTATPQTR